MEEECEQGQIQNDPQVREVHEVIMKDVVNPLKRRQEAWQTAKHRYAQQEVRR